MPTYNTADFKRQNLRARYWSEEQLLRFLKGLFSHVNPADFALKVDTNAPVVGIL